MALFNGDRSRPYCAPRTFLLLTMRMRLMLRLSAIQVSQLAPIHHIRRQPMAYLMPDQNAEVTRAASTGAPELRADSIRTLLPHVPSLHSCLCISCSLSCGCFSRPPEHILTPAGTQVPAIATLTGEAPLKGKRGKGSRSFLVDVVSTASNLQMQPSDHKHCTNPDCPIPTLAVLQTRTVSMQLCWR